MKTPQLAIQVMRPRSARNEQEQPEQPVEQEQPEQEHEQEVRDIVQWLVTQAANPQSNEVQIHQKRKREEADEEIATKYRKVDNDFHEFSNDVK